MLPKEESWLIIYIVFRVFESRKGSGSGPKPAVYLYCCVLAVVEPLAFVSRCELHLNPDSEDYAYPRIQMECVSNNVCVTLCICQVCFSTLSSQ